MRQETKNGELDPYLWLEEIEGKKPLEWVSSKNKKTIAALTQHPRFQEIYQKNLEIYNSQEEIPHPVMRGNFLYNFWKDEKNERGLLRRTSLQEYRKASPKWETLLDIDELSRKENEKWVFKGTENLPPDGSVALIKLSREGKDAIEIREFDYQTKEFVKNGFYLPEAIGNVCWLDEETLLIATDFGEGSLNSSGYPRIVKTWKRGTPLEEAETLFEGENKDNLVLGYVEHTPERKYQMVYQGITIHTNNIYMVEQGRLIYLDIPKDAKIKFIFKDQVIVHLKSDWNINDKKYKQGTLISIEYNQLLQGNHEIQVIEKPGDRSSLKEVIFTKNFLLIHKLTNVRSELYQYQWIHQKWQKKRISIGKNGSIHLLPTNAFSDNLMFVYTSFLVPPELNYAISPDQDFKILKTSPKFFDSSPYEVEQFEATSKDGTRIPYFLVSAKGNKFDGNNPTLLHGYGGYEFSLIPFYSGGMGASWLEQGGFFALANIRGGGEFGPKWHQAAIKEKRQNAFDDFIAVAENLIEKKVTSPKHLGIHGGSFGGLLVGAVFTQRPELFGAVVCLAPLLDMKRYHKMLVGALWVAEIGDPDIPEEWAFIKKYSPYHNLSLKVNYPRIFFSSSTTDDRVHPGHARKMVAKMEAMGHEVFYYESTEGGHSWASTNQQRAFLETLVYSYLLQELGYEKKNH